MSVAVTDGLSMADYVELLARLRPEVVELAECLCLAAAVERSMLRRARLRFLPRSSAGLEAELWFSPLVEAAGDHALLLDPEAAGALRRRLARRPRGHVEDVRDFTVRAHRDARPITRWFEDLLWADVDPSAVPDQYVRGELRRVLGALAAGGEAADDLGRWVLHYLPRLPENVRRYDDAWRMEVASSERLGLEPPPDRYGRPAATTAGARALVHRDVSIGVAAHSDGVVLSNPPADGARVITAPGVRAVRLDVVSTLVVDAAAVRVRIGENQSVRLPMTVMQWLDDNGTTTGLAHPSVATETVVARAAGTGSRRAHGALLLEDGRIVLHGRDGSLTGVVPAPPDGRRRSSLTLSSDGGTLAWMEEGTAVVHDLASGRVSTMTDSPGGAALARVLFPADARTGLVRAYEGADALFLLGDRGTGMTGTGEVTSVRDLWISEDGTRTAVLDRAGKLWTYDELAGDADVPTMERFGHGVTAVTGTPSGGTVVWATADGVVRCRVGRDLDPVVLGTAPWQVTGLAVHDGGGRVAAVGGDTRMLLWEAPGGHAPPLTVVLRFCANRVHALPGGTWAVSGTGGPVELRTEDGRRYQVVPDTEAPVPADDVPTWARGCVIADVRGGDAPGPRDLADGMADVAARGVGCLLVAADQPLEDFALLLGAAHRHGIRVVRDIHLWAAPRKPAGGLLTQVRRFLDTGVDGIRLVSEETLEPEVLNDVRHLLDGYGDRLLLTTRTTARARDAVRDFGGRDADGAACHVVMPAWDGLLGDAVRKSALGAFPGTGAETYAGELAVAEALVREAGPGAQWGHVLPKGLRPAQRAFAARVLLTLPGCPVLPLSSLEDRAVSWTARLRRDHLALSRGESHVVREPDRPEVLVLVRRHGDETVLCLANSGTRRVDVQVPADRLGPDEDARLLDLLDGSVVFQARGTATVLPVDAHTVRCWRRMPAARTPDPGE
ncbi:alpha-amylase family protein [Streptomyces sp. A012304]|uniref:alpha-amylase family protein n=1 Tax=Streptomyces sp. A012304 TaxID=375446 RepID=UPI00222F105E|nr:alpha-amylase family protein [Streptomyces sp. A012304]GKQ38817.1 hypothetical protein ALMP_53460 [Streptomyces sp. A012304]